MSIKKVGVIGAGNMGGGIAQKIAQEGIEVVLVDMEERFVEKGLDNIRKTLAEAVERRIFTAEEVEKIISRIEGTTDLEGVKDADLVIEAVFEDMDVKKKLFGRLDGICGEKTVFATNTSSFSVSELASAVTSKNKFLGLHFFYHPAKNRLLEVIPGEETGDGALAKAKVFSSMIRKTDIDVKDAPGFAVNRFFVPWLNEAVRLHGEGISIRTIDETAKEVFKIGMGPFKLMNVTGVPIAYHSTVTLGNELGDFYSPAALLKEQFESGEKWDLEGVASMEDTTKEWVKETAKDMVKEKETVKDRLLGCVFTVACQLVDEGVASMEDTDRGAKIGLRWRRGPFEMMNGYGIERTYDIVKGFADRYSLPVPDILRRQREKGEPWSFEYVDLEIRGSAAWITIDRPEALNAINETVMEQLDRRFGEAEGDPGVRAVVLAGAGKAFVAGADIQFFVEMIEEDRIEDIVEFTEYGHQVLGKIDNSSKLVIAKLDGLALGGGAEIALTADVVVATDTGKMGFPETGIGIYPGLGGTQRTARYVGKELAKYLVFTGRILDAGTAERMGLVEYVVPRGEIDRKIEELIEAAESGAVRTKSDGRQGELPEELKRIKIIFSAVPLDASLAASLDDLIGPAEGLDEEARSIAKTVARKAPMAIELAGRLIEEGSEASLEEGLRMELEHLPEIFSTEDAYEGLRSVLERRRPEFKGK